MHTLTMQDIGIALGIVLYILFNFKVLNCHLCIIIDNIFVVISCINLIGEDTQEKYKLQLSVSVSVLPNPTPLPPPQTGS